jgi:hypothetical protein
LKLSYTKIGAGVEAKWALERKVRAWQVAPDGGRPEGEDCFERFAQQNTASSEAFVPSGWKAGNANRVQILKRATASLAALSCGMNPVKPCMLLNRE